jgi:hypothetical protein
MNSVEQSAIRRVRAMIIDIFESILEETNEKHMQHLPSTDLQCHYQITVQYWNNHWHGELYRICPLCYYFFHIGMENSIESVHYAITSSTVVSISKQHYY